MKKVMLAGALLAASMSTAVLADENPTGFYAGGGFGRFNLDIDNVSDFGSSVSRAVNDNDNTYKLFAGYRFAPFLALQAAYVNLGRPGDAISSAGTNGRYRLKMDGFAPSVIGTVPIGPLELSGELGYYYYNVDVGTNLGSPGSQFVTSSHSRSDFFYGAGLGITVLDHLNVKAEYQRLDLKNYKNSDVVWLTAAWRF
jgi:opacity protein-like surface antigen